MALQDQLVPGTLEHTINRLVEENIDLSVFDERYKNDETGAAAIHPKILVLATSSIRPELSGTEDYHSIFPHNYPGAA